ncbi:2-polyprenyl-6-methoxyphenol hydroxylase-like FAD-dependent oxidoreductase [Microterricola gilva]|uniref:2-polyprenyl-6-methoxyphenol hydroxylase-like FAD-dependent oxidoreductase n=1 Tax=Microterricola gilva TaxID=393267 RepID=A0A4Q8APN7_9MICO|nr:NAD(P)/FAD-dependent oxidoreductase [Microterricola gilva]RZU65985.1 2-polyprenyl-6-methoxyphenol hydroxylase-like FAD-dependent oxidoreductase [Microterricola gilva]
MAEPGERRTETGAAADTFTEAAAEAVVATADETAAAEDDTEGTAGAAASGPADSAAATDAAAEPDAAIDDAAEADIADVAVVGAGPVGLLLACLLVQRGLSVTVLEARGQSSEHSRAIGIHPPGIAVLAQLGIAEAAIAAGTPIFRGEAWCDGEMLGALEISEAGGRYPFVLALPQRDTERLLRDRLTELNGGVNPVRRGIRVTAVSQRSENVELTTKSAHISVGAGSGADAASPRRVLARYVVGADGARSRVRELAGIRWVAVGQAQPYLMADFRSGRPPRFGGGDGGGSRREGGRLAATTALLAFERGGVVESFPLPDGWRRWVVLTDRLWHEAVAADLAGIVRDRTGIELTTASATAQERARTDESLSAFAVRQHRASRMAADRVALLGDAAHEVSPIGGQGMNLGWLDAAALAPALELAVRGGHELGARALREYDLRRRLAARRAVAQAAFNMQIGREARGARLGVRNALVRALGRPPFRALLARAFTMRGL